MSAELKRRRTCPQVEQPANDHAATQRVVAALASLARHVQAGPDHDDGLVEQLVDLRLAVKGTDAAALLDGALKEALGEVQVCVPAPSPTSP